MMVNWKSSYAPGLAVVLMTALSGCTAMNETDKADLKATPTTPAPSTDMAAVVTAPAMYDLEDGTQVAVLLPTPKPGSEISLALAPAIATPVDTANAAVLAETPTAAVAVASAQNGLVTAMVAPTDTTLTAEISAVQSIVPTPKPATATMLAYAAPSKGGSLAAIDNQYDLSGPAAPQIIAPAPGAAALSGPTALNGLISKYAKIYDMPEALIHRVVHRESRYNPAAFNGGHYGLMQIKYATAKSMGYDGPAAGLFDAETNIKYAAKYLRGAWLVADNSNDNAVRLYARGYYYDAKSKGMLHVLQP